MRRFAFSALTGLFLLAQALLSDPASAQGLRPPPEADAFLYPTAFLACDNNPYALCYYSGPDTPTPRYPNVDATPLPCTVEGAEPGTADCVCYAITEKQVGPLATNFVLIGSILDDTVRAATIEQCGPRGKNCLNMVNMQACKQDPDHEACQRAKVCDTLGTFAEGSTTEYSRPTLYDNHPDGDEVELISTFSFTYSFNHPFGSTNCAETPGIYAGCMTAPCKQTEEGLTTCACPLYEGKYQVGQSGDVQCDISPNVWSAADNLLQNR